MKIKLSSLCFQQTTAVTVFQGLSFILISHNYATSPMSQHDGLQRAVIDGLRILVEKYSGIFNSFLHALLMFVCFQ